jgi:hypothetical protein
MNVRAFTADESSGLDQAVRGSYLGFIDKVSFNIFFFVLFMTTVICFVVTEVIIGLSR